MKLFFAIFAVGVLAWILFLMPIDKPISRSSELPTYEESVKQKKVLRAAIENGEIEPDTHLTDLEEAMIEEFRILKGDPCNLEYVDAFVTRLETWWMYTSEKVRNGLELLPADEETHNKANYILNDAVENKFVIKSDLPEKMLKDFPLNNTERSACKE